MSKRLIAHPAFPHPRADAAATKHGAANRSPPMAETVVWACRADGCAGERRRDVTRRSRRSIESTRARLHPTTVSRRSDNVDGLHRAYSSRRSSAHDANRLLHSATHSRSRPAPSRSYHWSLLSGGWCITYYFLFVRCECNTMWYVSIVRGGRAKITLDLEVELRSESRSSFGRTALDASYARPASADVPKQVAYPWLLHFSGAQFSGAQLTVGNSSSCCCCQRVRMRVPVLGVVSSFHRSNLVITGWRGARRLRRRRRSCSSARRIAPTGASVDAPHPPHRGKCAAPPCWPLSVRLRPLLGCGLLRAVLSSDRT